MENLHMAHTHIWDNTRSSKIEIPQTTEVNIKEKQHATKHIGTFSLEPGSHNFQLYCIVLAQAYKYKPLIWLT